MRLKPLMMLCILALGSLAHAQGDPAVIEKILDEGKSRNQVMRHLEDLTIQIGSRLTG